MTQFVNVETGEMVEGDCPFCADLRIETEGQLVAMERELRQKRSKITKLENAAERDLVKKRDAAAWKDVLSAWMIAFPTKKPSATGIKSARATKVFMRLESGSSVEEIKNAIAGAMIYPYVVFGKRQKSGSRSDLADDIQEIVSVNNDANFDFLRDVGAQVRVSRG
jgi:hypothetical protein